MGASGVSELVDQAVELLGQHERVDELVEVGLTEDNAQAYIEAGPDALRETVAPVIERLKPHDHMEELIAIGLTETVARQWVERGADGVQQLYDRMIRRLESDQVEITPDIEQNLTLGRKIIEILRR